MGNDLKNILLFCSKAFLKIGEFFTFLSKKFYSNPMEKRTIPWFVINGDRTLRLNYDLNENSIVFDLGGYEGQWASDIFSKYCCEVHVFEPVKIFANSIKQRFLNNSKIIVHQFGLSGKNKVDKIAVDKDSSSVFLKRGNIENITLVKAIDFMQENNIYKIDLMKINIEGGEYDLLEHLIETGYAKDVKNLQIQFHDFVHNSEQRMLEIQNNLSKSLFNLLLSICLGKLEN